MDVEAIEVAYANMRQIFEQGQMNAARFQEEVDALSVQDDYGRYWMIGVETGTWYYYDGSEWIQANPREANSLPFVDEDGVYWVLGQNGAGHGASPEWYYYDGDEWVLYNVGQSHEATQSQSLTQTNLQQSETQYYQDEEGRYWSIGAKSGKWYYYDQDGWHLAETLPPTGEDASQNRSPSASLPVAQEMSQSSIAHQAHQVQAGPSVSGHSPYGAEPAAQTHHSQTAPFQPIQERPDYLKTSQSPSTTSLDSTQAMSPQTVQPTAPPNPSQVPQTHEAHLQSQLTSSSDPAQGLYQPPAQFPSHYAQSPTAQPAPPPTQSPPMGEGPINYAQPYPLPSQPQPTYDPQTGQPLYPTQNFRTTEYTQVYNTHPYPQSNPVPAKTDPDPDASGVWYYYPDEGSWCYYDGEKWIVYYDEPLENGAAHGPVSNRKRDLSTNNGNDAVDGFDSPEQGSEPYQGDLSGASSEAMFLKEPDEAANSTADILAKERLFDPEADEDGDIPLENEDKVIEIEDIDDFVEIIEFEEEDIIEQEEDLVDAEFEVSVFKPGQEPSDPLPTFGPARSQMPPLEPQSAQNPRSSLPLTSPTRPPTLPESAPPPPLPHTSSVDPLPLQTTRTVQAARSAPNPQTDPQPQENLLSNLFLVLPTWLWTSLAGALTLILTTAVIIFSLYIVQNFNRTETFVAIQPTQTLPAVFNTTPTPGPTPTVANAQSASADGVTLANYTNDLLGLRFDYAAGWVFRENEEMIIFAPSTRSLDPDNLQGAVLWVSRSDETNVRQLLDEALTKFEPITDKSEGTLETLNRTWNATQIQFQSNTLGTEAIALVAAISINDLGYTLVAVSPIHEWPSFEPMFKTSIHSLEFLNARVNTDTQQNLEASLSPTNTPVVADKEAVVAAPPTATPIPNTATPVPNTPTLTPTPTNTAGLLVHTIVSGDTLGRIAARYDVSVDDIVKANKLASKAVTLRIGQELFIPRGLSATQIETLVPNTPTPTPTDTPSGPLVHVVTAGETLGGLALQYDVAIDELMRLNNLSNRNTLKIGQKIIISQPTPSTPSEISTRTRTSRPLATSSLIQATATSGPTQPIIEAPTATSTATAQPTQVTVEVAIDTPTPEPVVTLSGRILYPAYSTDINSFNIWRSNLNGSDQEILVFNASQPSVSRNGQLFAYRSWDPSNRGIYYRNLASGQPERLTGFVEDALPIWDANGTIVFTSRREGDRVARLFRVTQRGGDGEGLGFNADNLDLMADGRIVARGCTASGDCGLWVMSGLGTGEIKISGNTSDTAPAARPQGGRIALMSFDRGGANDWEIWTINEDGSDPQRLTENAANDGLPAWSPDGQSIAFVSDRGGVWGIWVMNRDGSEQRKLFNLKGSPTGQVLHDTANSKGWLEERIAWQP